MNPIILLTLLFLAMCFATYTVFTKEEKSPIIKWTILFMWILFAVALTFLPEVM